MRPSKRRRGKQEGILECSNCHAYEIEGRWYSREEVRAHLPRPRMRVPVNGIVICPACDQLRTKRAAAVIELRGDHWREQQVPILQTIESVVKDAQAANNQERLLRKVQDADAVSIYVSNADLARHIGRTLVNRYEGRLEYLRQHAAPRFKVTWWSGENQTEVPKTRSRRLRRRGLD